jgi:hypothetical protein
MPSNESGSGATTSGGVRVQHYYPVGPAVQAKGFGWSLGSWGGTVAGESSDNFTKRYYRHCNNRYYISRLITVSNCLEQTFYIIESEEISYTGIC